MAKSRRIVINAFLLSVLLASLLFMGARQPVAARGNLQGNIALWFNPPLLLVPLDGNAANEVQVQNPQIAGLIGVDLVINFDPDVVQVVDADPTAPGVQVGMGTCFAGRDFFAANNNVDNENGRIEFIVTLRQPALPLAGNCSAARITWETDSTALSAVQFGVTTLVDSEGREIANTAADGQIRGAGFTRPPICGRVRLQGRNGNRLQNTLVTLSEDLCLPAAPPVDLMQASLQQIDDVPDNPFTRTDEDGCFSIIPYEGRDYRCLMVFQPGYLVGQQDLPLGGLDTPLHLGVIELTGGDVTEDDVINIFDLVKVTSNMPRDNFDSISDINDDGNVNISDLAIVASNFGRRGPTEEWRGDDGICECVIDEETDGDPITTDGAEERFERGVMLWNAAEPTLIYVLFDDDLTWQAYDGPWDGGDGNFDPPPGRFVPVRGFGLVWRNEDEVRERLGWAIEEEKGYQTTIRRSDGDIEISAYDGGVWKLESGGGRWEYIP